ncbi:putative ABC transport system permease protein [Amycolatopsis xylanica]|uniref:Putative ABC transport system permease protein n=1 Tax=Amycolatopsis xylanica TaxID=589385 RepID=A0A1H3RL59_9PSEU|nr:FtsX-like permease family protein [Amycolatopsis xylanica]SDZ26482.1 putative ABC transport system permease protein [Amycolatopsis xylanica]
MFRLAFRSILAHKARYLLPTLGVVLGVAFVVGSLLYGDAVKTSIERAQIRAQADVAVKVEPDRYSTPMGDDVVGQLQSVQGVAQVRPIADGRAFLVGKDGALAGLPDRAAGVSYDPARFPLSAGKAPSGPDEVAVDEAAAKKAGFNVGDTVRVIVKGVVRQVRLVGVFAGDDARLASGGTLVAFELKTAVEQFAHVPGSYTALDLVAAPGVGQDTLATGVSAMLGKAFDVKTGHQLNTPHSDNKITEILLIFAAVALFVAVFLVANTFTMLAAARARENALLRAVGASRKYVLRTVLAEATVLGLIATVLGYLLGIGAAAALNSAFAVINGPGVPLQVFSVGALCAAIGVGIGVTTVAAYIPARRAAAIPPIAALRTGVPPTAKSLRRRNIIGLVVTLLGAAITTAGIQAEDLIYLGAPVTMLGLIVLTPWFSLGLTKILRGPLTRLSGMRGTLAVENTRRNPRRTAATAATLMIGLSVCAAVTVPIASVAAADAKKSATADKADIEVTTIDYADLSAKTVTDIAKVPGVGSVTPMSPVAIQLDDGGYFNPTGVNPQSIKDFFPVTVKQGSLDQLASGLAISEQVAAKHGWTIGSEVSGTLKATSGDAPASLPIVAIYEAPESGEQALIAAPKDAAPQKILVKTDQDASTVSKSIQHALANPTLVVQTKAEVAEAAGSQAAVFLNILYALLSVSVLIGALGVVNTMTMSTLERVREIGLLRAVGLGRKQVGSVLRLESVIIAMLGALIGLVAGCALGAIVVLGQEKLTLVVPWERLGVFVLVTVAIGILASLWPARKAAQTPILTAIHADTE